MRSSPASLGSCCHGQIGWKTHGSEWHFSIVGRRYCGSHLLSLMGTALAGITLQTHPAIFALRVSASLAGAFLA